MKVSNIERFATHDGPGIRTTVFLKGCSLHCPWCANPETWTVQPVLMHDETKCVLCHQCEKHCSQQAISIQEQWTWDKEKCTYCQTCIDTCIPQALSMNGKDMTIDEILEEVLKDQDYYEESHGGMTLSGGEPLYQWEEVYELLKQAKEKQLHIAMETTGHYSWDPLEKASSYVDLFLFDIKHLDKNKMKAYTGANLDRILSNFERLAQTRAKDIIVRVPVIPGFNDDILQDIITYAKAHQVQAVHLLPYHSMGKKKWHQLNKPYKYENLDMMDEATLSIYASDFVQIGG